MVVSASWSRMLRLFGAKRTSQHASHRSVSPTYATARRPRARESLARNEIARDRTRLRHGVRGPTVRVYGMKQTAPHGRGIRTDRTGRPLTGPDIGPVENRGGRHAESPRRDRGVTWWERDHMSHQVMRHRANSGVAVKPMSPRGKTLGAAGFTLWPYWVTRGIKYADNFDYINNDNGSPNVTTILDVFRVEGVGIVKYLALTYHIPKSAFTNLKRSLAPVLVLAGSGIVRTRSRGCCRWRGASNTLVP
ncbi:hypothetical protein V8E55_003736 [Tylopilus felleus]